MNDVEFQTHLLQFLELKPKAYKKVEVPYRTKKKFACIGCCKNHGMLVVQFLISI